MSKAIYEYSVVGVGEGKHFEYYFGRHCKNRRKLAFWKFENYVKLCDEHDYFRLKLMRVDVGGFYHNSETVKEWVRK